MFLSGRNIQQRNEFMLIGSRLVHISGRIRNFEARSNRVRNSDVTHLDDCHGLLRLRL